VVAQEEVADLASVLASVRWVLPSGDGRDTGVGPSDNGSCSRSCCRDSRHCRSELLRGLDINGVGVAQTGSNT